MNDNNVQAEFLIQTLNTRQSQSPPLLSARLGSL